MNGNILASPMRRGWDGPQYTVIILDEIPCFHCRAMRDAWRARSSFLGAPNLNMRSILSFVITSQQEHLMCRVTAVGDVQAQQGAGQCWQAEGDQRMANCLCLGGAH
jgi:hypothetical protein